MTGVHEYTNQLHLHVGFASGEALTDGGDFGGSADYNHVYQKTTNQTSVFTQSDTTCCAYTFFTLRYAHPEFHPNFLAGLESLTEDYDQSVYRKYDIFWKYSHWISILESLLPCL